MIVEIFIHVLLRTSPVLRISVVGRRGVEKNIRKVPSYQVKNYSCLESFTSRLHSTLCSKPKNIQQQPTIHTIQKERLTLYEISCVVTNHG